MKSTHGIVIVFSLLPSARSRQAKVTWPSSVKVQERDLLLSPAYGAEADGAKLCLRPDLVSSRHSDVGAY